MDLVRWTFDEINKDRERFAWLEPKRVEWSLLLAVKLRNLLDGVSFLFFTDSDREWFGEYLLKKINPRNNHRPILPFFNIRTLYPRVDEITSMEDFALVDDLLSLSFPNGFVYFYVGKPAGRFVQFVRSHDNSYLWLLDEVDENGFTLSSTDEWLDVKLLSLFSIFDKSINAALFGKLDI